MKYSIYAALIASVSADCSECADDTPVCATAYLTDDPTVASDAEATQCVDDASTPPCGEADETNTWVCTETESEPVAGPDPDLPYGGALGQVAGRRADLSVSCARAAECADYATL